MEETDISQFMGQEDLYKNNYYLTEASALFAVLEKILTLTNKKYGNIFYRFKCKLAAESVSISEIDYFGDIISKFIYNDTSSLTTNLFNSILKTVKYLNNNEMGTK